MQGLCIKLPFHEACLIFFLYISAKYFSSKKGDSSDGKVQDFKLVGGGGKGERGRNRWFVSQTREISFQELMTVIVTRVIPVSFFVNSPSVHLFEELCRAS